MKWTNANPTIPGWYWTKNVKYKHGHITIQRVKQWEDGKCYLYAGKPVERHECQWAGPIPMPEEP